MYKFNKYMYIVYCPSNYWYNNMYMYVQRTRLNKVVGALSALVCNFKMPK